MALRRSRRPDDRRRVVGIYPTNPWPELQYIVRHCRARVIVCGDQEQTDKVLDARRNGGGLPDLDGDRLRRHEGHAQLPSAGPDVVRRPCRTRPQARGGIRRRPSMRAGGGPARRYRDLRLYLRHDRHAQGRDAERTATCFAALREAAAVDGLDDKQLFGALLSAALSCRRTLLLDGHAARHRLRPSVSPNPSTRWSSICAKSRRGFLGVPRIWEKMQQSVHYRVKDTTPFQRRVVRDLHALGRPIAERRPRMAARSPAWRDGWCSSLLWLALLPQPAALSLGIDRVRGRLCGGATVSPEVILFFWTLGVPVYQIYGMTESAGVAFMQRPGATSAGCCRAEPIDGVEQKLLDDGELLVKGPSVFKGYLFDEAATARTFADGWLRTGDIVEIETTAKLRVVDRKKDILITSGGKNITPSLIENALKDSPYIREAILLGDGRHFLAALIQIDWRRPANGRKHNNIQYTTYRSLAENRQGARTGRERRSSSSTTASRESRPCASSSSCRKSSTTTTAS